MMVVSKVFRRTHPAGRTPRIRTEIVDAVVAKTTQRMPDNATHWSTRTMARVMSLGAASAQRIWHAHRLKPHRVESFKVSNDPNFAATQDVKLSQRP